MLPNPMAEPAAAIKNPKREVKCPRVFSIRLFTLGCLCQVTGRSMGVRYRYGDAAQYRRVTSLRLIVIALCCRSGTIVVSGAPNRDLFLFRVCHAAAYLWRAIFHTSPDVLSNTAR